MKCFVVGNSSYGRALFLLEKNKKLNHACRVNKNKVVGKASGVEFYGMVIG